MPDAELARAKRGLIGSFALTQSRPSALLSPLMDVHEYRLPLDHWQTYPAHVQAVTERDVQRIARKYLAADHVQITALGPASKIEGDLRPEGRVDQYDKRGYPAAEKHRPLLRFPA